MNKRIIIGTAAILLFAGTIAIANSFAKSNTNATKEDKSTCTKANCTETCSKEKEDCPCTPTCQPGDPWCTCEAGCEK